MLMHFASAQPAVRPPADLQIPAKPLEAEEVTPPSGGRRSPSFSRPAGGTAAGWEQEREAPILSRTASEMDGINVLLGLATNKKADADPPKSAKRRRSAEQSKTPAAKRTLQVAHTPRMATPSMCQPLSGAKTEQLKVLAVAFALCPAPSGTQLQAIATRAGLSVERVRDWFRARRALHGWMQEQMQRQPNAAPEELVRVVWRRQAAAA